MFFNFPFLVAQQVGPKQETKVTFCESEEKARQKWMEVVGDYESSVYIRFDKYTTLRDVIRHFKKFQAALNEV